MIPSPLAGVTDLVSATVKIDGKALADTVQVLQLRVHREVNRIANARIVLMDGDPTTENFALSQNASMAPGKSVSVSAGYAGVETVLFEGLIVKHAVRVRPGGHSALVLTCYDKAIKLTQGRKSASLGKTDSDIMTKLIQGAGLTAAVDATTAVHDGLVRYYATDWDFLVCRAELNGMIVLVEDGKVTVQKPAVSGTAVLEVTYGDALQEIDAEIDARTQYDSVQCAAWDYTQQKMATATSSEPGVNDQGDLTGKKLAGALGLPAFQLGSTAPVPNAELKSWADAQLLKSRLARVRGSVQFRGNAKPKPGCLLALDGLGAHFDGSAFVSRVVHKLEAGDWITEVGFGLGPRWFIEETPDVAGPLASGLMPGVQGLLNATVKQIQEDPDGQNRIQVEVPSIGADGEGIWARLASGYATNKAGIFFMPEVGDEVVLGFLNGNPSFPVILGSLYSGKHVAPYQPDAPNTTKAIVTNAQLKISMDDVKKVLQIETPGGMQITMDDDQKTLTVKDASGNQLQYTTSGITLESKGDITIKAGANLNVSAGAAMGAKAGTQLQMSAVDVKASASMALAMQGQATAELTSSGQTTVRAPMVMIN